MNTPQPYTRRTDRALPLVPPPVPEHITAAEVDQRPKLATHGDPSLTPQAPGPTMGTGRRGVEWVRPTDLASRVSASATGRAIDLETALVCRVRRVPVTATRAAYNAAQRRITQRNQSLGTVAGVSPAVTEPRGL